MAFKQAMYSDFSGGFNDTISAIALKENETTISQNVEYSDEVKALKTRKGLTKVNQTSFGANITDSYSWTVGSVYKKCIVMNGKVYEFNVETGSATEKITLTTNANQIYPFVIYDKMYFGDGTELYVWGDVDLFSDLGVQDIKTGNIVKNNDNSTTGTVGNFYQSKLDRTGVNLKTDDYTNTTNWTDVTDVRYSSSNVVRKITPYDPSQKETVLITVMKGASASGTISLILNNVTFTCSITSTDTVPQIVDKLYAMTTSGWTKTKNSNSVKFTKDVAGLSENGYIDPSTTGVLFTYETIQEGKDNDNNLSAIKKCTMFTVHSGSFRVFCTGNPDDNALYYSEIGKPTYFKSSINKVYPVNGYGRITAIGPLSQALIVSYENGWYAWSGITPLEDATWKPLNLPYGCVASNTLALTPYSFTYLANDGIYTVSASILNSDIVLIQSKDIIKKITENRAERTMKSIKNLSICKAIFYDNNYYLAYNTDGSNNDKIIKYDWNTKSFTNITGWLVNSWTFDPRNLYFASKNYVLKIGDSYSDIDVETGNEKPIELIVRTKEYPLGNPLSRKVVQFLGFIFKQNETYDSDVDITLMLGYESENYTTNIEESLVWGKNWGNIWGYRESIIKMIEVIRVSNTFQVEIRNSSINQPITLIGIGFIYYETDLVSPSLSKDEVLLK